LSASDTEGNGGNGLTTEKQRNGDAQRREELDLEDLDLEDLDLEDLDLEDLDLEDLDLRVS
jgi:hypothetical protein